LEEEDDLCGGLYDHSGKYDQEGFAFTDFNGSIRDPAYDKGFRCYRLIGSDSYRTVSKAHDCSRSELAIAEDEFTSDYTVVRAEWLYEICLPGFKHSYVVLFTRNGTFYVTEKNRTGLMWYSIETSSKNKSPYSNFKGKGLLPDEARLHSKWHDGSKYERTTGILHREWTASLNTVKTMCKG